MMGIRSDLSEMKAARQHMGAGAFWALMIGVLVYCAGGAALLYSAEWPADCDPSGLGRGLRLLKTYQCSPHLLGGDVVNVVTAIWLWAVPVGAAAFVGYKKLIAVDSGAKAP